MNIKIILISSYVCLLIGCENPIEQNTLKLQISFNNNSPYHISNLSVANKLIGNLPSNSSSNYFGFEKFRFDTGLPDEDASADVNGKILTNYYRGYWCGTEKYTIESGKYLISVEVIDTILFLSCKSVSGN